MRVLAVDPGYARLGLAVLELTKGKDRFISSVCVETSAGLSNSERLRVVGDSIRNAIRMYSPHMVAVESLFFSKNQKTALLVAEARGVALYEAARARLPVRELNPLSVKLAVTGDGRSDKRRMMAMVSRLVTLPHKPKHDDELDAIAIALACLATEAHIRARN